MIMDAGEKYKKETPGRTDRALKPVFNNFSSLILHRFHHRFGRTAYNVS